MEQLINRIRFFHFISGVLLSQQADPLCGHCRAFANTVRWTRDCLSDSEITGISGRPELADGIPGLLDEARRRVSDILVDEDAVGQKKAGNCRLPQGVCLVKMPKSVMEKL